MEILSISIIAALALELFYKPVGQLKGFQWFIRYRDWIISLFKDSLMWNGAVGVISVLAVPFVILLILQSLDFFSGSLLYIPALLFNVGILTYCLRYHILYQVIDQLSDQTEDQSYGKNKESVMEVLGNVSPTENNNEALAKATLVQANGRLYGVIFWFLILGPAGALLYRMVARLAKQPVKSVGNQVELDDFDTNANRLFGIMSWIPARLSAAGYALAGGFEDAVNNWRDVDTNKPTSQGRYNFLKSNEDVLYRTGAGAIALGRYRVTDDHDEAPYLTFDGVKAAQGLVLRTLLLWVAIVVVILLANWAS